MRKGLRLRGMGVGRAGVVRWVGAVAAMVLLGGCQSDASSANPAAETSVATNSVDNSVATQSAAETPVSSTESQANSARPVIRTGIGFRSEHYLDEHFTKHGREFGGMSKSEYLLAAQTLRDRPVGGDIEEISRPDGTSSRFDKASGAFLAFDRDGTIRTFFKPNDGERYFRRQAMRSH
jgi:hypothetical protein